MTGRTSSPMVLAVATALALLLGGTHAHAALRLSDRQMDAVTAGGFQASASAIALAEGLNAYAFTDINVKTTPNYASATAIAIAYGTQVAETGVSVSASGGNTSGGFADTLDLGQLSVSFGVAYSYNQPSLAAFHTTR